MTVKIQQFQLSKNKYSKATRIANVLYIPYCEPGPSTKAESSEGLN